MCDKIPDNNLGRHHPDLQWIHMTAKKATIYICIVYSHPNDPQNHRQILDTLEHNLDHLRNKGHIIIMGDFNARCPDITGEKVGSANSHSTKMEDFINTCDLVALTNNTQQKDHSHYSFQGPNGESIPDYVLVPREQLGSHSYSVNMVSRQCLAN